MAEYINRERARFEAERYFKNMDETKEDLDGCCFDSVCIFGLEDTQPTEEEIKEFQERLGIEL